MKDTARKALYATVGAPVVIGRKLGDLADRMRTEAGKEISAAAKEGEKLTGKLRDRNMVEELSSKVDLDQIQGQVEKLRDQLENVLAGWREQFRSEVKDVKPAASTKRTPATKATPARTTTAKKATTTRKPTAKKAPAKKATTTRKPTAKKATTTRKPTAAKATAGSKS